MTNILIGHVALLIGFLLAILVVTHVLTQRRSPSSMIAWLVVIVLFPYVGVPLYLALGDRKMKNQNARQDYLDLPRQDILPDVAAHPVDLLLRTYGLPGSTHGNKVQLCRTGEDCYRALVDLIENAQESICISTYLIRADEVGKDILARLVRKAKEGVQVRLLMDGVGCLLVSKKFLHPLVQAGGKTAFFMPLLHRPFRGRTNLRNHRKIALSDQKRVMAGGTNIASEYIGPVPIPDRWRDLSFVIEGPAVRTYAEIFRSDWAFASGEDLVLQPDQVKPLCPLPQGSTVQIVPSGPDMPGDPLYDAILFAMYQAACRIWIVTPYFVPDETLSKALALAARRGVQVRILVPEKSNHQLADWARGYSLRQILAHGGHCLMYTKGMVHAKAILIDETIAATGSANMDMRSLFLDHEVMMFAYSAQEVREVENWMSDLAVDTQPMPEKVSFLRDIGEGVIRMLAPLL